MPKTLTINGKAVTVNAAPETPLLWVLRDELQLTGTKYGCGIAQCGACTVHMNGTAIRSCQTPISALEGAQITTIEGLGGAHPVQASWVKLDVPQCGYCQSGQIVSAVALLAQTPRPSDADIDAAMSPEWVFEQMDNAAPTALEADVLKEELQARLESLADPQLVQNRALAAARPYKPGNRRAARLRRADDPAEG